MKKVEVFTQEQKTDSLRKALIEAGYEMASSQVEDMEEDVSFWGENMIDGRINPYCIDICDQASHSFYCNELDIWIEPDEKIFPEGCSEGGLNELIENNFISDEEVFELLYEGANNYINKVYGKDWKEKYPKTNNE